VSFQSALAEFPVSRFRGLPQPPGQSQLAQPIFILNTRFFSRLVSLLSPLDRFTHQHARYPIAVDCHPIERARFSVPNNPVELKIPQIHHQRLENFNKVSLSHRPVLEPSHNPLESDPHNPSTSATNWNCTDWTRFRISITKTNYHCHHTRRSPSLFNPLSPRVSRVLQGAISVPILYFESSHCLESGISHSEGARNLDFIFRVESFFRNPDNRPPSRNP